MRVNITDRDLCFDRKKVWQEWLRHHCIEPRVVSVPGWVETDAETRQVRYWGLDLNEYGKPFVRCGQASRSVHVVQLEARPSPLPFTD